MDMKKQIFINRRKNLIEKVVQKKGNSSGPIFLWANFEQESTKFRQEATFYYFTGINEPGVVLQLNLDGTTKLFIPNAGDSRSKWVSGSLEIGAAEQVGVDEIVYCGDPIASFSFSPLFSEAEYKNVLQELKKQKNIFTCYPLSGFCYTEQVAVINRLQQNWLPGLTTSLIDITLLVTQMRQHKDKIEIEQIFKAVQITSDAIASATELINTENTEQDVYAGIEYVMTLSGASPAFPSIVASGKNGAILHYAQNDAPLKKSELVLIDCGASYDHYCADLSRTFPISGTFNKRQRALYALVLECQDYVASLVKPGIWLNNKEKPEQSLNHLAIEFFEKKGYAQYFVHGIGHYLGLTAHDVGSYQEPLEEGDVITLEPGLYLPDEQIGIRIEDNYWVIKDGVHCLSEDLPKAIDDIEELVKKE